MCLFYKQFVFVFVGLCLLQHEVPGLPKHKIYEHETQQLFYIHNSILQAMKKL